ncbi:MAG: polysaccharide deacetylase family protein [Actinomycetota bacterium]|nr:polysaccharide deacetylase family protein [Actinomycetota bacterium]
MDDDLVRHYEIERELADRLRSADQKERERLYGEVYDELFRRLPAHPQLVRKHNPAPRRRAVASQLQLLRRFVGPEDVFLEIGAGDCALSLAMTSVARQVVAVDVSKEISHLSETPANFELLITNGRDIPVPAGSVAVAYSNQLMEHLHPDDAAEQLENIYRALAPGGVYICSTPNRLSGPHDVSRRFDEVATGFHLREYTTGELSGLMHDAGFQKLRCYLKRRSIYLEFASSPVVAIERALERMPQSARRTLAAHPPVRPLLGDVVAYKANSAATEKPGAAIKGRVKRLLETPAALAALRRVPTWSGVLILSYHRVADNAAPWADPGLLSARQGEFDEQLAFLTQHLEVIAPEDLISTVGLRGRRVLITFDDGYRDNFELAYPVLRSHGVQAAFFLATGFLDQPRMPWWEELAWIVANSKRSVLESDGWLDHPISLENPNAAVHALVTAYKALPGSRTADFLDYCAEQAGSGRSDPSAADGLWMTWDMVREMQSGGMTFGGHTVNHPVLSRLGAQGQEREVAGCKQRLEEELGEPMTMFSYPVGLRHAFDAHSRRALRRHGVRMGFSCYGGYQRHDRFDPFDIPRASVGRGTGRRGMEKMAVLPRIFARW